jgi:DNA-directed RNA polymerase specialized sigma24 family protein
MMADRDEQFGEWMAAHLGVLHRISRAFAEPADQHDLLQELMIAVWKALNGLTETAVGARLTRARQRLTDLVEGDGDGL